MAGRGGLRARAVRAGGRARARVAKAQRAPFSSSPHKAARLSDSLRIRGPERLRLFARRPLLKLLCGSMPQSGADLASQPTISRLENAPSAGACYRMAEALFELYLTERGKDGRSGRRYSWISTRQTTPPTANRKEATTTATTGSTCTTPCSSSTATRGTHHGAVEGGRHPREPTRRWPS